MLETPCSVSAQSSRALRVGASKLARPPAASKLTRGRLDPLAID
jgi:hypothetical protein